MMGMPGISTEQKAFYDANGYLLVKHLFSVDEVEFYKQHFMQLREQGSYPGDSSGVDVSSNDPLRRYPRMIHMHRWDAASRQWMIDPRMNEVMTTLLGREPFATQTMFYFKPPQARGQALHQDQYYLRAQPGTCMAAWMAVDACDEANGCLQVVPGSHTWPVLCTTAADTTRSFTDVTVPIPPGTPVMPIVMQPGDVLFFNGSVVHGSLPNTTTDRFRRALIGHYVEGDARQVHQWYHPVVRMDGNDIEFGASQSGDKCGVWVDEAGTPVIEMQKVAPIEAPASE
jgi:ectoine hydroxylase-related dioxygenase (phytanoyl-CoA dioxygenase family)